MSNAKVNPKLLIRKFGSELIYRSGILSTLAQSKQPWRVLMYHRVTSPEIEGYSLQAGMYVTPDSFKLQMEYLAKKNTVIELDSLVAKVINKESIAANTVAISFDDGWKDNYEYAYPVLKELGLPATIFLATSFINSDKTFWSDATPCAVSKMRNTSFDKARITSLAQIHELRDANLEALFTCVTCNDSLVQNSLEQLIINLKQEPEDTREGFAMGLLAEIGGKEKDSFLSWEEVREMSNNDIQFGSHTHTHRPLDELSENEITKEIRESKEELLGNQAAVAGTFCYPEGRYSTDSQRILAELGIMASLSTDASTDLEEKPALIGRIGIHDDITNSEAMFASRVWF